MLALLHRDVSLRTVAATRQLRERAYRKVPLELLEVWRRNQPVHARLLLLLICVNGSWSETEVAAEARLQRLRAGWRRLLGGVHESVMATKAGVCEFVR